jgi:23S rRNA (uridine2552-2'-O)-methyltransferase
MGKAWIKKRKRDKYYRAAKREHFRSRSAFKLIQIQEKFGVMEEGWAVLDLGSSPGGWSQVSRSIVGDEGAVFAVDIVGMTPIEGVKFFHGDLRDVPFLSELVSSIGAVDVVISDMAPRLSGNKPYDQARALELAEIAFDVACACLRDGGNFVTKAFRGEDFEPFLSRVSSRFQRTKATSPPATSKGSAEVFVIAKGFKGQRV